MKKMIKVKVGPDPVLSTWRGQEYLNYQSVSIYPDTSLKGLISQLQTMQEKYRDRFQDMEFEKLRDCGCPYDCSCSPSYVLYGKRYETDLEEKFRIREETRIATLMEERQRREYEELKKKFG